VRIEYFNKKLDLSNSTKMRYIIPTNYLIRNKSKRTIAFRKNKKIFLTWEKIKYG
jgi:hypothetical protein